MSSHGIPEVLMKKVDDYVDSLAPQIQPRITTELELFQQKTIDTLEDKVVDAFRSLFDRDRPDSSGQSRNLDDTIPGNYGGQALPFVNELAGLTRSFTKIADETSDDLRDIFNITEGHTNTGSGPDSARSLDREQSSSSSQLARGFLSSAINAVQDHLEHGSGGGKGSGGQGIELDGLLGVLSSRVKDVARSPEDTARSISPEIKDKIGAKLREQHAPIAEQFTHIALDHIKRWLRGNTSTRDLGDGAKGEIEEHVKDLVKGLGGLLGHHKKSPSGGGPSRGLGDRDGEGEGGGSSGGGVGFSKVISEKLSTGLGRVHRDVRLEFRKVLGGIEKQLFELLPDEVQGPLEKILGGNPFDSQLERDATGGAQADRGFRDDIKTKLVSKIRGLVRKVQEMLRESILGVVNGGHRKFERESWVFVQNMVEQKVQKYLPRVKITVPDDIGNEGVNLGAPKPSAQAGANPSTPAGSQPSTHPNTHSSTQPTTQFGSGNQFPPPPPNPPHNPYQNQPPHGYTSGQHQSDQYRPEPYRPDQQRPDHGQYQHQSQPEYRPDQYRLDQNRPDHQDYQQRPPQEYRPQEYHPDQYQSGQHSSHQEYRPDQHRPDQYRPGQSQQPQPYFPPPPGQEQPQGHQQNHGSQDNQWHGQNPPY